MKSARDSDYAVNNRFFAIPGETSSPSFEWTMPFLG